MSRVPLDHGRFRQWLARNTGCTISFLTRVSGSGDDAWEKFDGTVVPDSEGQMCVLLESGILQQCPVQGYDFAEQTLVNRQASRSTSPVNRQATNELQGLMEERAAAERERLRLNQLKLLEITEKESTDALVQRSQLLANQHSLRQEAEQREQNASQARSQLQENQTTIFNTTKQQHNEAIADRARIADAVFRVEQRQQQQESFMQNVMQALGQQSTILGQIAQSRQVSPDLVLFPTQSIGSPAPHAPSPTSISSGQPMSMPATFPTPPNFPHAGTRGNPILVSQSPTSVASQNAVDDMLDRNNPTWSSHMIPRRERLFDDQTRQVLQQRGVHTHSRRSQRSHDQARPHSCH